MSQSRTLVVIRPDTAPLPPALMSWAGEVRELCVVSEANALRVSSRHHSGGALVSERSDVVGYDSTALLDALIYRTMAHAAHSGLVVYSHHPDLLDAFARTVMRADMPFALWMQVSARFTWAEQHLPAAAALRFSFDPETAARARRTMVYDCDLLDESGPMPDFDAVASRRYQHPDVYRAREGEVDADTRKALLISYFTKPAQTVAVQRIAYWTQMLPLIAANRGDAPLDVTTLTAVHSFKTAGEHLFVRDRRGEVTGEAGTRALVERLGEARVNSFAAYWADDIRRFFLDNPGLTYETVILSGNPFYYFELAAFFKAVWGARVILDFRDPFAHNPRFEYSEPHKRIVTELERDYIGHADFAVSVNSFCVDALELDEPSKGVVVANGYDERIVNTVEPIAVRERDGKINFIYTGSFYADRDAEPFLQSLDPERHRLVHIGRSRKTDAHLDAYPGLSRYGLMSYEEVVGYCKSMDVGVIFTSGEPFEQTTKIFDYIAAGLNILIITQGEPYTGELHNLTQDLPGVFWVENQVEPIRAFLDGFAVHRSEASADPRFSRYSQTETLYGLIA